MLPENARCELCCFVATWLGVAAFVLLMFGVIAGIMSQPRLPWVVASAIAFVLMIALASMAVLVGRRGSR